MDHKGPGRSNGKSHKAPMPLSGVSLTELNRRSASLPNASHSRNAAASEKHKSYRYRESSHINFAAEALRTPAKQGFYDCLQQPVPISSLRQSLGSHRPQPRATPSVAVPFSRNGVATVAPVASQSWDRSTSLNNRASAGRHHLPPQFRKTEDDTETSLIHASRLQRRSDPSPAPIESKSSNADETNAFATIEENRVRDAEDICKLLKMPDIEIPPEQRSNTPREMHCKLMEHQKVALKWLKDQEKDRHKRGGLLADTMGLGKTIEALALILANRAPPSDPKTTLIIAPLALLKQWDREIADKVKPAYRLTTFIYHGQDKKTRKASRLFEHDVVITTYGTVSSEYANFLHNRRRTFRLFGGNNKFHRIILDEAHKIKNRRAQCSTAVAALEANYRLCMTGTVFMNNTAEIFPLIRFLRIKPYDEWVRFKKDIDLPLRHWASGEDEQAAGMRKLQVLFRSITLRRTKDSQLDGEPIITLPTKSIAHTAAVFDEDQKAYYDALEKQQQIAFNKYIKRGELSKVYTFILVLLLRLRQACCHPFLIKNHGIPDEAQLNGKQMVRLAMRLDPAVVTRILRKNSFQCPLCGQATETPILVYPCGHDLCSGCFSSMMQVVIEGRKNDDPSRLFGGDDAVCPCEDCDSEVHPKRVLCHNFFLDAHAPESGSQDLYETPDDDDDDDDCKSLTEDSDEDSEGDEGSLKDFIVSEGEETEGDDEEDLETYDEKGFRSCIGRTPTPVASASEKGEEDEESEGEEVKNRHAAEGDGSQVGEDKAGATRVKNEYAHSPDPFAESGDDLDQASADRKASSAQEGSFAESELRGSGPKDPLWDGILERYRRSKEAKAGEDFDSDDTDFLSVKDWAPTPNTKPVVPRIGLPKPSPTKKRSASHHDLSAPDKRIKREAGKASEKSDKTQRRQKKRQGKGKELTLGQLRKVASSSQAAKAKYFKRLRKDFESSAKMDVTLDLLRSIRENKPGEKALVFSLWPSFLDLLQIPLEDEGFRFLRYDGSMTFKERDDNVEAFSKDANVDILLVSLLAGNAGLNLTAASQVIILEPFWNPFVEDQAIDRVHRIGQKKDVDVHRVLVADTVEDRILELQEKKRKLVNAALSEEGAQGAGRLSIGDLRGLFGF